MARPKPLSCDTMKIGHYHTLTVEASGPGNVVFSVQDGGAVSLATDELDAGKANWQDFKTGDTVTLFVHHNKEGHAVATTHKPHLTVGECGLLNVVSNGPGGAWLDWGLSKDLFLPISDQTSPVRHGEQVFVYIYLDPWQSRVTATTKLHQYLSEETTTLEVRQSVNLIIAAQTPMGYKAVINNEFLGLLYREEVFQPLSVGDQVPGFVKTIRPDHRIDLTLNGRISDVRDDLTSRILAAMEAAGGTYHITDKSPPDDIYDTFQVSKKNYKRALSALYKARKIVIKKDVISLVDPAAPDT